MLFCTKRFYCFVYSEKEKQMQKIREKLEAKQLKKARLVSFVNKRCFFFHRHSTSFPGFSPMQVGENPGNEVDRHWALFSNNAIFLNVLF